MGNSYQVFHSRVSSLRKKLHVILVRPQEGGNVGATARVLENMGIEGSFRVVGAKSIVDEDCRRMAKNAQERLDHMLFYSSLEEALDVSRQGTCLSLAATARIGSSHRPHPLWVRPAAEEAIKKLERHEVEELLLVFGPEGSGLTNDEIVLCDWVVTIPSLSQYRSLNLAQSVLIFCYELHMLLMKPQETFENVGCSQKERLVTHILGLAEEVGFILPGDPYKMKPRLEGIFSRLPHHIGEAKTLHGLLGQVSRSLKKGAPNYKGRFRRKVKESEQV